MSRLVLEMAPYAAVDGVEARREDEDVEMMEDGFGEEA